MATGDLQRLFLLLSLIFVVSRLGAVLARRLGQPAVIGQIAAGIALGPSALGPFVTERILSDPARASLTGLADIGVAIFMFVLGHGMDRTGLREVTRPAMCVSAGNVLAPLAGGFALAFWLAPRHDVGERLPFVLFIGVSLAVTALPVLARILIEQRLIDTSLGRLALPSAVFSDVVTWVLLAVAISASSGGDQWRTLVLPGYLIIVIVLGRLGLPFVFERLTSTQARLSVTLIGLLLSAMATEWMGVHFIFGAFVWGACQPRELALTRDQIARHLGPVQTLLLPIYFVVAGLSVDLVGLHRAGWIELPVIVAVAAGGKLVGAYAGARAGRVSHRQAMSVAALMNTRGLTELIVLSAGFDRGILDRSLYTTLVVMALVTTAGTVPLLRVVGALPKNVPQPATAH